jgi:regulator of nonsense transcripts 3
MSNVKLKVVVRRLPPDLPEEIFLKTVQKWQNSVEYMQFCPGKAAKK